MLLRIKLSNNFYLDEFACSCCSGIFHLRSTSVDKLQILSDRINDLYPHPVSIILTSACRCISHQKAIYKARGKEPNLSSGHLFGIAFDIKLISNGERVLWEDNLIDIARELFNGIGITESRRWIHVDIKDRKAEWSYKND